VRRFRIGGLAGCAVLAVAVLSASPSPRPLELTASPETARLGIVTNSLGTSLVRVDPTSLNRVGRGVNLKGLAGAWSFAPDSRLLAVAVRPTPNAVRETLRFYTVAGLKRAGRGVPLGGAAAAVAWLRPDRLLVSVNECCADPNGSSSVVAIDTTARRVVARTLLEGSVLQVASGAGALVLLVGQRNGIGPSRLELFDADGARRTVATDEIAAGVKWPDDPSGMPIGTRRVPGLALDPTGNRAFVAAPDGLVATVDLASLVVTYHRWTEQSSALDRLARWVTPAAEAKGTNGPALTARWLGGGFLAVAGTDETAFLRGDNLQLSSHPLGLRIIDVRDWSASMLDAGADALDVDDGVLLARGSSWSSDPQSESGMGIAAYGVDRARRFHYLPGQAVWIGFVYRGRAYVSLSGQTELKIVDLSSGQAVGTRRSSAPWPLLDDTVRLNR
jgi:hypothetical protein